MKKIALILFVFIFSGSFLLGQEKEVIKGKSEPKEFNFIREYKRQLPPNLFVSLDFEDENRNGIMESNEKGILELKITNRGKGTAQGLIVEVSDSVKDENFVIEDKKELFHFIYPNKTKKVEIPIKAGEDVETGEHKLSINVTEHFGYDMDPAYLILNTMGGQKPDLTFSGMEIVDQGEETAVINPDGQLQAGELVKAKLVVQNIGQKEAKNIQYKVSTKDENIFLKDNEGTLGNLGIGEVKEFWVTMSPNKRVKDKGKLPIYLTLEEESGKGNLISYQLPVKLDQQPPEANIEEVRAEISKLQNKVARFEYSSNKFEANVGDIKNIRQVSPSKTKRKNAAAVVIGVENYDNIPPAPYAANDAEIMKKYFKNRLGIEQVVTLTNDQVTGFAFDDIFNPEYGELQKAIIKGETDVFVFYSGHGLPSKDGEDIYLFPSDGKVERLKKQGYHINKLYTNLEKLGAKSVTVFMDACFSGASKSTEKIKAENLVATKGVRIKPKIEAPWQRDENFTVFSSSSADETSLGFDPSKSGLFTYYLCAGMQGGADANEDHKITLGELKEYVIEHVKNTSKKIRGLQTPEFHGKEDKVLFEY